MTYYNKIIIAFAITSSLLFNACGYNQLVELDERADKHWYQIEDAYNRQNDLIPLLVKEYKNAEPSDIKAIEKARKAIADYTIEKDDIEIGKMKQYVAMQQKLTKPVDNLLEDLYRDIKDINTIKKTDPTREKLKTIAAQIKGSHNRIAIAIDMYNKVVDEYNEYQGGLMQKATSSTGGFQHKEKLNPILFERKFPNFDALDRAK